MKFLAALLQSKKRTTSVWRRLKNAQDQNRGIRLSAREVQELFRATRSTINEQVWYEEMERKRRE